MNPSLESVLQHPGIWRGDRRAQTAEAALPTGFAALDALLPGGGWPRGALTELLLARQGIGELRLLMPALAQLPETDGWLAWVAPPYVPYAAALAAAGIDLKRLVVAKPPTEADAWWTAEQALRSGACGALLAWLRAPDERRMRRLQLAAETGHAWGVLFRHARAAHERSPAALRLLLEPAADGLAVHILKRRGGPVSQPVVVALPQAGAARRPRRTAPVLSLVQA
ncbi:translesion DNA synthesis-associated protein ImuA [Thiobacillus sedimenti]|uniref:Translesion DNA synthesis-associated protein ImuA n=1 Tax=Thiobacillus sedimenti TaxID=3110231 RepID=A0ABZ1CNT9_9PROT|nr:translesion DNA synthesis-associated protein ImuA [Thiobacillus sp. SCUT-2]WRS40673.1 translesion DNA synthesis-associated protein ImuA [Thiobacillus sp. SCUT-2]